MVRIAVGRCGMGPVQLWRDRDALNRYGEAALDPSSNVDPTDFTTAKPVPQELIAELQRIAFAQGGPWYAWSHHNHRDIEVNGGGIGPTGSAQPHRAKRARDLIKGKWRGWGSNDVNDPRLFLTEGGARLDQVKAEWFGGLGQPAYTVGGVRSKQAQLVQDQITRLKTGSEGVGMCMAMQYLVTSSIAYDTGLRDAYLYNSEAGFV